MRVEKLFNIKLNQITMKGVIAMWSGNDIPDGWVLCDGTNNTPDLRGRFILGSGKGDGLNLRLVNEKGGDEKNVLSIGEMPAHTHKTKLATASAYNNGRGRAGIVYEPINSKWQNVHGEEMGGNQPFSIMPPYYVLAYIMKL